MLGYASQIPNAGKMIQLGNSFFLQSSRDFLGIGMLVKQSPLHRGSGNG